jgi:hypothetical protein
MPKGEKVWAQSKRTAPPPPIFKILVFQLVLILERVFQLVWFSNLVSPYVQKKERVVFSKSKPSWTLRGGSHLGGVLFSQRKSIWNKERKFQILKMLYKILFIYLWLFAKGLWKEFTKEFAKQNMWCKHGPKYERKKQSMHIL